MPSQVAADTDLYTLEWDDDPEGFIFTWNDFSSGQRFRDGANAGYEEFKKRPCENLIVDASAVEAHDDAEQQWIQEEWTPKMVDAGAYNIATVTGDSVIAEMDAQEIMDGMDHLPHDAEITASLDEARDWIARQ